MVFGDRGERGTGRIHPERGAQQPAEWIGDHAVIQLGENLVPPVDGCHTRPAGPVLPRVASLIQQHAGGGSRPGDPRAGVQQFPSLVVGERQLDRLAAPALHREPPFGAATVVSPATGNSDREAGRAFGHFRAPGNSSVDQGVASEQMDREAPPRRREPGILPGALGTRRNTGKPWPERATVKVFHG